MIEALISGERRGAVMADPAKGRARTAAKLADLSMALEGRFTDHHALMCRLHLDSIKGYDAAVEDLDKRTAALAVPWQREQDLLRSVPGFGDVVAQAWIAEIGPAPHQWFSSDGKLASWVSLAPGNYISAGKRKHGRTGDAGTYIKPMLVQAAWAAIRAKGRLQARYNRLVRRFGGTKNPAARKKAIIAIAHTLLKIAYHVLKTGTPTRTWEKTSTPAANPPAIARPGSRARSTSSTPAAPSPSPSARPPIPPRRPP
jgi:transposase